MQMKPDFLAAHALWSSLLTLTLSSAAWAQQQPLPEPMDDKSSQESQSDPAPKPVAQARDDSQMNKKFATADLEAKSGSKVSGAVIFSQTPQGIQIMASVKGAKPGKHGFHIHENGDCSALDASSAGAHYNPTSAKHAGIESAQRHVGDLGNITIKKNGTGVLKRTISKVEGFSNWQEITGKSVVMHANTDDLKSQPSGKAGPRVACGLILAVPETAS